EIIGMLPEPWKNGRPGRRGRPVSSHASPAPSGALHCSSVLRLVFRSVLESPEAGLVSRWQRPDVEPVFRFRAYREVVRLQAPVATLVLPDRGKKRPRIPLAREEVRTIRTRYHDALKRSPRARRDDTARNEIIKQLAMDIGYPSWKELKTQIFREEKVEHA